jgi:L-methionine (R)-S-oxide reductase
MPGNDMERWLEGFVNDNGGVSGTLHLLRDGVLVLQAAVNIPPPVVAIVQQIPKGKGMAGLAWERDAAVDTCNLKTDSSGDVRPGARAVNAQAAVAIPIHDPSGAVRGVAGIAYRGERELPAAELAGLTRQAEAAPAG